MRKLLHLLCLVFSFIYHPPMQAQNFTTVTASNVQNASGTKLASGQLCFLGTDQNNNPISFMAGGGGQVSKRAVCTAVTTGAIGSFQVANPANTNPLGIVYRVTVTDATGLNVITYTLVSFSGASFNFDNYQPGGSIIPPSGGSVNGPLAINGNLSVTGATSLNTLAVSGLADFSGLVALDGNATITSAPPSGTGTNQGWKYCIYGTAFCEGMTQRGIAKQLGNVDAEFFSIFGGTAVTYPANDGTSSLPDSHAKLSFGTDGCISGRSSLAVICLDGASVSTIVDLKFSTDTFSPSSFQFQHLGGNSPRLILQPINSPAIVGNNYDSGVIRFSALDYTGGSSQEFLDLQYKMGAGTNPTNTLLLNRIGTSSGLGFFSLSTNLGFQFGTDTCIFKDGVSIFDFGDCSSATNKGGTVNSTTSNFTGTSTIGTLSVTGNAGVSGSLSLNGNGTITSTPGVSAQNNIGWKDCAYSNQFCFGIANATEAHLLPNTDANWLSIFGGASNTYPANDGSTSAPDSHAKVTLGTDGSIRGSSLILTAGTGDCQNCGILQVDTQGSTTAGTGAAVTMETYSSAGNTFPSGSVMHAIALTEHSGSASVSYEWSVGGNTISCGSSTGGHLTIELIAVFLSSGSQTVRPSCYINGLPTTPGSITINNTSSNTIAFKFTSANTETIYLPNYYLEKKH